MVSWNWGVEVATIDPWQMVFDQAVELADSLLQAQPKGEVDSLDIKEQVIRTVQAIASGEVAPREDWSVIVRPVNNKVKLDEKIDEHFDIALRQAMFVRVLFEYHMKEIKENYVESVQPSMLMKVGEEMLFAFACAQQHATAWRLLTEVRDKSYEARSQKATQAKNERKEEREVLLRSLIEASLRRLRPRGRWRTHILAAQEISVDLAGISDSLSLPISNDPDELSDKVQLMIWKEPQLRKTYNENAREPLPEPVKIQKGFVKVDYGDED